MGLSQRQVGHAKCFAIQPAIKRNYHRNVTQCSFPLFHLHVCDMCDMRDMRELNSSDAEVVTLHPSR